MSRELTPKSPSGRVKRTPIGTKNRLTVRDKDPNYVYRIVNADPDRLHAFKEAGYEAVNAGSLSDNRVDVPSGMGSVPEFAVGQGTKAVVMRIKREWYEEDQAQKQADIDALEATTKQEARQKADYGSITSR